MNQNKARKRKIIKRAKTRHNKITRWRLAPVLVECPVCKYRTGRTEREYANFDFDCPECNERKISQFYQV